MIIINKNRKNMPDLSKPVRKKKFILYKTIFKIVTPVEINYPDFLGIKSSIEHALIDMGAEISIEQEEIVDNRDLRHDIPYICSLCKHCIERECWYHHKYYGQEFGGDYDVCFDPKTGNKDVILAKYYEAFKDL